MNISIEEAKPEQSGQLSEIALKSKAYWPYDDEFIDKVIVIMARCCCIWIRPASNILTNLSAPECVCS